MAVYNKIGIAYNTTRQADPYLADRIFDLLKAHRNGIYLDLGCGTGNYLKAMVDKGLNMVGIDPSETMLQVAQEKNPNTLCILGKAEDIPAADAFYDGVMAILTTHHWPDLKQGLKEIKRVLKPNANLVIFSFTPTQQHGYWLAHYFPEMMEKCAKVTPETTEMFELLKQVGFQNINTEKYFIQPDLKDQFMYAGKYTPEAYLDEKVRNGTSGFSLFCTAEELETGLKKLKVDIESGYINSVIKQFENDFGDYLFYQAS